MMTHAVTYSDSNLKENTYVFVLFYLPSHPLDYYGSIVGNNEKVNQQLPYFTAPRARVMASISAQNNGY